MELEARMQEVVIETFEEFHKAIPGGFDQGFAFRGVPDCDNHDLIPSVGRYLKKLRDYGQPDDKLSYFEESAISIFELEGPLFFDHAPANRWELLALAQHYGVPTRLLDWSRNPLVALYFAMDPGYSCDAAVYATRLLKFIDPATEAGNPFKVPEVFGLAVSHLSPRLNAQAGLFTIQPDPMVPVPLPSLHRIRIKAKARIELLQTLFRYGIHEKSMFPDLQGLGSYIKRLKFELWDASSSG